MILRINAADRGRAFLYCTELNIHVQITNGSKGFKLFEKWCKVAGIDLKTIFIAMEYTGGYEYKLMQYCESKNISYCRIPGLAIKNSLGIIRGKTDKVDARRIAQYAVEKSHSLNAAGPINTTILELRQYLSFRKRLVRESAGYKATLKERKAMYGVSSDDMLIKMMTRQIKDNSKLIKKLEDHMQAVIQTDQKILMNYKIIS